MPSKLRNARSQADAPVETRGGKADATLTTPHAYLIRIADAEARQRAIMVLGEAREPYCGFTDYRLLVTNEHLEVLKRESIPFEILS